MKRSPILPPGCFTVIIVWFQGIIMCFYVCQAGLLAYWSTQRGVVRARGLFGVRGPKGEN